MIENLLKKVAERREAAKDAGFSLLELVVAVGILLVLTVGGLLAYNGITDNARTAAVQSAASEVFTSAAAYEADNRTDTNAVDAGTEWSANDAIDSNMEARSGVTADGEVGSVVERTDGTKITHSSERGADETDWV